MRASKFLLSTLKETPADAEVVSHQLMLRAGLIRRVAAGIYNWMPMGLRVLRKVEQVVREEMERAGALELTMPVVQPGELWEESGRWEQYGPELCRLEDRHQRPFCLGPTHEEIITQIARSEIKSYKQLPINLFQIQTKFRDEIRPRFGVMRSREFIMKDGYSFHLDQPSFDATYEEMYRCYERILTRMELEFRAVQADTGNIGGDNSHEFHVLAQSGEDTIAYSDTGTYAANLEKAAALTPEPAPLGAETISRVDTPNAKTIDTVAAQLGLSTSQNVKTLIVEGEEDDALIAIILRGDHELNEVKAAKLPGVASPLTFAAEERIPMALGASVGSLGPVGCNIPFYVDASAASVADFVCGANEDGVHFRGVNWQRDVALLPEQIVDVRKVVEGDSAPDGDGKIQFLRGIEVGHIFQLDRSYSEPMQASVLDHEGNSQMPIMGCYGMGVTRLVAAVIEQNHDENGITWPEPLAPFQLHIIALHAQKSEAVREAADNLYQQANDKGLEVLLDDRDERPGVKFAEADLIGIPHQIVVGDRGLKSGVVEYRKRRDEQAADVPLEQVLDAMD